MKPFILALLLVFILPKNNPHSKADVPPAFLLGNFTDDYGSHYKISDTLWQQGSHTKYHIIKWNNAKQYLIAKNDASNPGDQSLYTRIDYMTFTGMEPWHWGFCLTAYKAPTDAAAEATAAADRKNPKKGCGGFPFSRMMAAN